MMRRRLGRNDLPLSADVNVTSLVDVAFTLLVIFIITAPIMQGGIDVDVPKADVQPLQAEHNPFFVSITRDGSVWVGDQTKLTVQEFRESFGQIIRNAGVDRVYIRGDSLADWGPVLKVIASTNDAGVDYALVAETWEGN